MPHARAEGIKVDPEGWQVVRPRKKEEEAKKQRLPRLVRAGWKKGQIVG